MPLLHRLPSIALAALLGCSSNDFSVESTPADAADDSSAESALDTPVETSTEDDAVHPPTCRGPSDCTTDAKYCCADLVLGPGTMPTCPMTSGTTECRAVCVTNIPFSCPATGRVKLCQKADDCADDTSNKNCCQIAASGMSANVCVSDLVKNYAIGCL